LGDGGSEIVGFDMTAEYTGKKQRGRPFKQGASGNPAGRPKGARNRTTLLVEQMIDGEAEALTETAIRLAKAGDAGLMRALLDRLAPPRRERAVQVDLPPLTNPTDGPKIAAALLERAASGELTPTEAQGLAALLESYRKQSELADMEARLRALETGNELF
jgi:hypothetical protein